MKNLINYKELSRLLAGNETSISRNRIPKKYQKKVDSLVSNLDVWVLANVRNGVWGSERLKCEHEWKSDTFDCYGIPVEKYCENCGKIELY